MTSTSVSLSSLGTSEEAFYTIARDILNNLCSKTTDSSGGGTSKPVKITDKKSKRIKFFKCSLL